MELHVSPSWFLVMQLLLRRDWLEPTSFLLQVNMDEDAGEEEMEWLMEELEASPTSSSSSSQRCRSHHGNGHITTKRVNTDGLRSFSLDDQEDDSEDEVLSVPGVRVLKPAGASRNAAANHGAVLQVSARPRMVVAGIVWL